MPDSWWASNKGHLYYNYGALGQGGRLSVGGGWDQLSGQQTCLLNVQPRASVGEVKGASLPSSSQHAKQAQKTLRTPVCCSG